MNNSTKMNIVINNSLPPVEDFGGQRKVMDNLLVQLYNTIQSTLSKDGTPAEALMKICLNLTSAMHQETSCLLPTCLQSLKDPYRSIPECCKDIISEDIDCDSRGLFTSWVVRPKIPTEEPSHSGPLIQNVSCEDLIGNITCISSINNSQSSANMMELPPIHRSSVIAVTLAMLLCLILIGNIKILLLIGIRQRLRLWKNALTVHLAFCGLLVGLIVIPFLLAFFGDDLSETSLAIWYVIQLLFRLTGLTVTSVTVLLVLLYRLNTSLCPHVLNDSWRFAIGLLFLFITWFGSFLRILIPLIQGNKWPSTEYAQWSYITMESALIVSVFLPLYICTCACAIVGGAVCFYLRRPDKVSPECPRERYATKSASPSSDSSSSGNNYLSYGKGSDSLPFLVQDYRHVKRDIQVEGSSRSPTPKLSVIKDSAADEENVQKSLTEIRKSSLPNMSTSETVSYLPSSAKPNRERRSTVCIDIWKQPVPLINKKTILFLTVIFIVTHLPITIFSTMVYVNNISSDVETKAVDLHLAFWIVVFVGHAFYPFLYFLTNRRFRLELHECYKECLSGKVYQHLNRKNSKSRDTSHSYIAKPT